MQNQYTKRKVAPRDARSCLVCLKPTACVLYNASIQDWFHCCELHLQDNPQFAKPVYPAGYQDALGQLAELKRTLDAQRVHGSGSWDTWVNKLISRKPKSENDKDKEPGKEPSKDPDEEPGKGSDKEPSPAGDDAACAYQQALDRVARYRKNLRTYSLSQIMFESRLEAQKRAEALKQRRQREQEAYTNTDPDELQAKFAFPSVPRP
ncbi:VPS4-associated protein 1 [Lachancea thermotolerans]|uniref:KLTH0E06798p n=1 Tax=Lachancea thermotolerans (strain ATCC 56472 / CBS 6340 / NRRL Y-8284) TaxID=559295 RepID=C5DHS7_LACTC|nr:KLTH0E06798p [Lachancea thermotolerans CBS 6340]CAR23338.1 KLTH0E06798p [Lachancea thermotolerans CBS 6340]